MSRVEEWLRSGENEHLEFKEARSQFKIDDLAEYCIAIANEGGGHIVLGITDKPPRQVVGSAAFPSLSELKRNILDRLQMRVDAEEMIHEGKRVVAISVPSRPVGMPLHYHGRYLMRANDSLVSMTPDQLQRIMNEAQQDFSRELCRGASLSDLDGNAIDLFRESWVRKSRNERLRLSEPVQLLHDADLMIDGHVTNAAIILLGSEKAVRRFLPSAEIIFEWRDGDRIEFQDRRSFRTGLFLVLDNLWDVINLRNTRETFREGLFVRDIPTFNEFAIREAILNAIAHRDYRSPGSVFIRQYPRRIEIQSPGGFPPGVTADNLLFKQLPRNRCLSEALQQTGLVERSGQGVDRMVELSIREGKAPPDFSRSDVYQVIVVLEGILQDPAFLRFLETVIEEEEGSYTFAPSDLLVLHRLNANLPVPPELRDSLAHLHRHGIVERIGHGRGTRYILSRRLHEFIGDAAGYVKRRGIDRQATKELLATHIKEKADGTSFAQLCNVVPSLTKNQVKKLLQELKNNGRIQARGFTRSALWYPIP
ncbi:MAG TPA: ATP-binding protein [Thermoanaerobaculia bacterium]|nr:ATP-binding protein [Thermoanaerobaculia bacterium]